MRNFSCVLSNIDPAPLMMQLTDHPELWNNDSTLREDKANTVLYALNNISLRRIKSIPEQRAGSGPPFINFEAFDILWSAKDIVFELMHQLHGEILSQVVISRMRPGEVIEPHIDRLPPGYPLIYQRYQIPLSVKRGVRFICGDEELFMEPGNAYWFDNQVTHSVHNDSSEDRISMRVDLRPFSI